MTSITTGSGINCPACNNEIELTINGPLGGIIVQYFLQEMLNRLHYIGGSVTCQCGHSFNYGPTIHPDIEGMEADYTRMNRNGLFCLGAFVIFFATSFSHVPWGSLMANIESTLIFVGWMGLLFTAIVLFIMKVALPMQELRRNIRKINGYMGREGLF